MTTCFIVRHADKEPGLFFNPALRHQDEPLSQAGRKRAGNLVPFFQGQPLTAVYVSEYVRTAQTARAVSEALGLVPVIDRRLNEFDNGRLDGLDENQIQAQFPEIWKGFQDRSYDFRFPGGETGEEARARIAGFLEQQHREHPAGTLLAVCHEGLIRLMMCHLMGIPVYKRGNFHVDFCGITEIRYQPEHGCWKLIRFNQACPG